MPRSSTDLAPKFQNVGCGDGVTRPVHLLKRMYQKSSSKSSALTELLCSRVRSCAIFCIKPQPTNICARSHTHKNERQKKVKTLLTPFVDWCCGVVAGVTFGLAAGVVGYIPSGASPALIYKNSKTNFRRVKGHKYFKRYSAEAITQHRQKH